MVTLHGEKKRWNGSKSWCLNDLVNPFNPCATCSLRVSLCFPRFFSPKNVIRYDNYVSEMRRKTFILLQNFAFLPDRIFVAMTTSAFLASEFLPRHRPLAPNLLFSPGKTFVAMATYDLGKHGFWNFIPAMATICCSGDILPGRILLP